MELTKIIMPDDPLFKDAGVKHDLKPSVIKPNVDEWTALAYYNSAAQNRGGIILEPTALQTAASIINKTPDYVIRSVEKCRTYQKQCGKTKYDPSLI